jgi:hypothetical protein
MTNKGAWHWEGIKSRTSHLKAKGEMPSNQVLTDEVKSGTSAHLASEFGCNLYVCLKTQFGTKDPSQ